MLVPAKINPIDSRFSQVNIFLLQNVEPDLQTQRLTLRQRLIETLQQHNEPALPELLDLLKIPQHAHLSLSLSHTKAYSCFGWCAKPISLGVDIEDLARLKQSLVARVSSPSEMATAPRWELLWSCKEAVFKAFPPANVLSFVEIFDFQPLQNDVWRFRARNAKTQTLLEGAGEVRLILGHTLAFFALGT
jgi:phosphopantetheinyl transferase (holo-ACP synthase)